MTAGAAKRYRRRTRPPLCLRRAGASESSQLGVALCPYMPSRDWSPRGVRVVAMFWHASFAWPRWRSNQGCDDASSRWRTCAAGRSGCGPHTLPPRTCLQPRSPHIMHRLSGTLLLDWYAPTWNSSGKLTCPVKRKCLSAFGPRGHVCSVGWLA